MSEKHEFKKLAQYPIDFALELEQCIKCGMTTDYSDRQHADGLFWPTCDAYKKRYPKYMKLLHRKHKKQFERDMKALKTWRRLVYSKTWWRQQSADDTATP